MVVRIQARVAARDLGPFDHVFEVLPLVITQDRLEASGGPDGVALRIVFAIRSKGETCGHGCDVVGEWHGDVGCLLGRVELGSGLGLERLVSSVIFSNVRPRRTIVNHIPKRFEHPFQMSRTRAFGCLHRGPGGMSLWRKNSSIAATSPSL